MELEKLGLDDFGLIDGERVDTALNLREGQEGEDAAAPNVVLLTDRRVIHLNVNGRTRKAVFASLQDVEAVEIAGERRGYGGFIWAGMAFVVAIMLWRVWDHPVGSFLAAVAVAMMGVYLIVDHLLTPGVTSATFKAGSSQLRFGIDGPQASAEVYAFVNRLFELKGSGNAHDAFGRRRFTPR